MQKRKNKVGWIGILFFILLLVGCKTISLIIEKDGIQKEDRKTETVEREKEVEGNKEIEGDKKVEKNKEIERDKEGEKDKKIREEVQATRPKLPSKGKQLSDFVPEDWELLDSIALDFNQDGVVDFIGVLDHIRNYEQYTYDLEAPFFPRILFAIASEGTDHYSLDFQDINAIRSKEEGGIFGDPYLPLTAEEVSFTTHSFGGSAWKWSEDFTYTYQNGIWYLTEAESTYGYGGYITEYKWDDYKTGIGIRKKRNNIFSKIDLELYEKDEYDLEYQVALDAAPTLFQAGMRRETSLKRIIEWPVASIVIAEGIDLDKEEVVLPQEVTYFDSYFDSCNEEGVYYTFWKTEKEKKYQIAYLAYYQWQDNSLSVLVENKVKLDGAIMEQDEIEIGKAILYKGKLYYCKDLWEEIAYYDWDGQVQTVEQKVGKLLYQMKMDGTYPQTIFCYYTPKAEEGILENRNEVDKKYPNIKFFYEICGNEIIVEVFLAGQPHPYYRVNLDSGEMSLLGYVPK